MPVDASIYSQAPSVKSVADYDNEYLTNQIRRQGMQQNQLAMAGQRQKLDEYQRGLNEQQTIRNALMGLGGGATDEQRIAALKGTGLPTAYTQADALQKSALDRLNIESQARERNSTAGKNDQATTIKARQDAYAEAASLNTPEDAIAALNRAVAAGKVPMQAVPGLQRMVQSDPLWKLKLMQGALDPDKLKEALMPHFQAAGGAMVNTNPLAGPTGQGAPNAIPITQSPDNIANNRQSAANNAATIAKDLQVAGVAPGGGVDANSERTAQAIASGQLPAPTGMALLNPKNQRILGRVMEINPQYDSTTVDAKKKAARDFTSGPLGNAMRSFNVAGQHLDQLGTLVDALNNGNTQIINKIGNAYAEQTGSAAPTNFDAAKDVVSKEVVKAIVAGGGGVAERQELSELMSKAKSPAQLKGVIQQYRNLMSAQHDALLQQRRAAGLPDSTLPNYAEPRGGANADIHKQAEAILNGGK